MNDRAKEILTQVIDYYLQSGDFNGLPVTHLMSSDDIKHVRDLITLEKLDLVRGDGHPNPHIKAFDPEPIKIQLEKIDADSLAGCLYPTPEVLRKASAGVNEIAPYTRELMQGAPQLSYKALDLRVLEWYRNDPRFYFDVDDIHGRIMQRDSTQIANRQVILDDLEFFEFGFAYNDNMNRAVAAFVRYLHDLPSEQQIEMKKHELKGEYKLHPGFFQTQIIGAFPERISIYDAFLGEKKHINNICNLMGKPQLFNTDYDENRRPQGFGILIRATKKEFRDFALQLDQLLSDDLNRDFFKGDVILNRKLTDEDGIEVVHSKGTIALLEEWISAKFRPSDPEPIKEMFSNFRTVRKTRQKPAHRVENNEFDQKYISDQRDLITKGYDAVHTLRMVLENHPAAQNYNVPSHIRNASVWAY